MSFRGVGRRGGKVGEVRGWDWGCGEGRRGREVYAGEGG